MYFRMTEEEFNFVHYLIKYDICKWNTELRRAVTTEERLAVCLRFLATGNSFRGIGFSYRLEFNIVREKVKEICDATWKRLAMPPQKKRGRKVLQGSSNCGIFQTAFLPLTETFKFSVQLILGPLILIIKDVIRLY